MYDTRDEAKNKGELPFLISTQRSVIMKTFLEHENISLLKFEQICRPLTDLCFHAQDAPTIFCFVQSRQKLANFF